MSVQCAKSWVSLIFIETTYLKTRGQSKFVAVVPRTAGYELRSILFSGSFFFFAALYIFFFLRVGRYQRVEELLLRIITGGDSGVSQAIVVRYGGSHLK